MAQPFCVGQRWRMRIQFPGQDVVSSRITVIDSRNLGWFGCPWIRGLRVLLVLGFLDHAVKQALEGSLITWRL